MSKHSASRTLTIAIVGPGNLGSALAVTLSAAQFHVTHIAIRRAGKSAGRAKTLAQEVNARLVEMAKQTLDSDLVWLTVPDDAIAGVARQLAKADNWKGKIVFHSSGALSSAELAPLRARGARVASVHPLMTFVRDAVPEMAGVAFALEGDRAAVRAAMSIIKDLGGNPFVIQPANKVLYHVFGSFASPLVIALLTSMEQVALRAGIHKQKIKQVMWPLLSQTLHNHLKHDAAAAFSGPLIRGDVATVRKHLAELRKLPEVREVYVSLALAALKHLPTKNSAALARVLRSGSERFRRAIAHDLELKK